MEQVSKKIGPHPQTVTDNVVLERSKDEYEVADRPEVVIVPSIAQPQDPDDRSERRTTAAGAALAAADLTVEEDLDGVRAAKVEVVGD